MTVFGAHPPLLQRSTNAGNCLKWVVDTSRGLTINIVNPGAGPTRQGMAKEMRQMSRECPAPRLVESEEMVLPSFTSSRARSTASMASASTLICGTHPSHRSRPTRRPPRRCRNPPAAGLMMRAAVIPPESQRGAGQRRASVRRGRQTWHCCTTGTLHRNFSWLIVLCAMIHRSR